MGYCTALLAITLVFFAEKNLEMKMTRLNQMFFGNDLISKAVIRRFLINGLNIVRRAASVVTALNQTVKKLTDLICIA